MPDPKLDGLDVTKQQQQVDAVKVNRFAVQAIPFLVITFFGYLGPTITRQLQPGKFSDKARVGVQEGIVGFLIGGINGWLILSTLARFAYNQSILPDQGQFPTVGQALFRRLAEEAGQSSSLSKALPSRSSLARRSLSHWLCCFCL